MKEKVVLYGRTSTYKQKEELTIENQKEVLRKFARDNNFEVYKEYYDDGVSGFEKSLIERPQGLQLFKDAKNNKFKKVIILKADRFGRNLTESLIAMAKLEEFGVKLIGVYENLDDDFNKGLNLLLAQRDRTDIMLRFSLGRDRAIREGRWVDGNPPYGYIIDSETKKLKIFEPEAEIIRRVYDLCVIKKLSCPKIAKILNEEKIPPYTEGKNKKIHRENVRGKTIKNAKFWWAARIIYIIKDPAYKGEKELGKKSRSKEKRILKVEPIVSEEMWDKAQKVLRTNKIESLRNRKRSYVLTGLIYCNECGRRYSGLKSHGILYYGCNGCRLNNIESPEKCFNKNIRADILDKTVWSDVKEFIRNPELIRQFLLESHKELKKTDYDAENKKIEIKQREIVREIDRLLDMGIEEDGLGSKRLGKKINKLNNDYKKLDELREQYIELQQDIESEQCKIKEIENNLQSFLTIIDNPTSEQKEKILKLLVDRVVVYQWQDNEDSRTVKINYKFNKNTCSITKLDEIGLWWAKSEG